MEAKVKKQIDADDILKILDACYQKAVNGIDFVSPPIDVFADNYLEKASSPSEAAKKMIDNQVLKCTTSGVITGFGGIITLPVAVPANVTSVLYIQVRMIACVAYLAGYDPYSDQVQTLVYACLAGVAVGGVLKKTGTKIGEKVAINLIKKIPGTTLTKINQRVGFRLVTKFGEKGMVNLGKLVPGVGALLGGGLDFLETRVIANRAYHWFFEGDFSVQEKHKKEKIVEVVDFQEEG